MIDRQSCRCRSCRQRDEREFARLAARLTAMPRQLAQGEEQSPSAPWRETLSLVERINAYGYGRRLSDEWSR